MTQDELKLVLDALKGDMTERKTLKMALGTLEAIATSEQARDLVNSTIVAIRRVLAQPEQEPVAWLNPYGGVIHKHITGHERNNFTIPLYTTPPQRKPLTDEQIMANDVLRYHFALNGGAGPISKQGRKVIDAIEAAHGIKE